MAQPGFESFHCPSKYYNRLATEAGVCWELSTYLNMYVFLHDKLRKRLNLGSQNLMHVMI